MVIISDTSALSCLIQVGKLDVLHLIFNEIIIPTTVFTEISKVDVFRIEIEAATWIKIRETRSSEIYEQLLERLDAGEADAISLSVELSADFLIIDERKGRKIATELGINVVGFAGVLVLAKKEGHVERVKPILDQAINEFNFSMSDRVYKQILKSAKEL